MNPSSNGTILIASNANTSTMPATAKVTNINLNQTTTSSTAEVRMISLSSVNSSLSSTTSSYSMSPHTSSSYSSHPNNNNNKSNNKENESVIDMKTEAQNDPSKLYIRVSISDQSLQKVLKFNLDETVWNAKQRVLATLAKEVKDGLNYGFYLPPYQGRAGKFLDDCRLLKEYPLNGPVAQLEFKYKKRVYKFIKINQKELKALNVKSNYKRFLDLVRTNQVTKANRFLEKGLDPNFHSDLGETALSVAASLAEPRNMIMALYNGGAHLDFRSRDTLTPMHKAAIIGNDKALKTLLELGAFAEVRDGRMLTPLYYSIVNASSVQSIEYLLFNGSSIGVKDENNWQEVHHACKLGLSQHLDHLIYYGCDINAKNNAGNTPLHLCAIHNQENCARILMFRGCLRSERNQANQTPYDSAVIAGNHVIADSIKSHKESDTVPIRERPFYNTKRRSIYFGGSSDSQSNYSVSILNNNTNSTNNGNPSINGSHYASLSSNSRQSSINENNMSTLSSTNTTHTLIEWNNSVNSSFNNSMTTSSGASNNSNSTMLRSRSMPKLDDDSHMEANGNEGLYAITSATMIGFCENQSPTMPPIINASSTATIQQPQPLPPNVSATKSGSSSPTSRSRSISSDDHGFGSASLSQMSGSPNIEYAYPRKRLYPSIPNRTFVCIRAFKPTQPGEIELKKGDIVELLSIGDSGFWEGRSNSNEGWFKANCVEEFTFPKDTTQQTDSVVVKRKTLFDLITQNELNVPRTVVLQRGKKGFGFVLRGAKTTDCKFEPTLEVPALQFLESVDKDSNAEKAQLKPLDFVLEINGIDVTCKTHYECVKLIKKTGDTLALKVYTVNDKSSSTNLALANSSNLASTSSCGLYQTPASLSLSNIQNNNGRSHSYYAASSITNSTKNISQMNGEFHHSSGVSSMPATPLVESGSHMSLSSVDINNYVDGTKSLPSKKKPIPPARNPSTSLTSSITVTNNKSTSNLAVKNSNLMSMNMGSNHTNDRRLKETQKTEAKKSLAAPSIISAASFRSIANLNRKSNKISNVFMKVMPSIASQQNNAHIGANEKQQKNLLKSRSYAYGTMSPLNPQDQAANINQDKNSTKNTNAGSKRFSFSNENMSFMNSILAQIDELDKTLAEYDTTHEANGSAQRPTNEQEIIAIANKTKLLANDANAASIRTRVPVRKPGINNGEIFIANSNTDSNTPPKQHPHLNHKTLSVPNLFQLAPAPTPPVAPPAVVTIKNNSAKSNSTRMVPMTPAPPIPPTSLIPVAPPPLPLPLSIPSAQNFKYLNNNQKSHIYSAPITNSTLIRDPLSSNTAEQYDYSNQHKNLEYTDYEPANDYDEGEITLDSFEQKQYEFEPVVDYDQTSLCSLNTINKVTQMSTFNHNANLPPSSTNANGKANSNLILMMLKQQQQQQQTAQQQQSNSSPLTPRQIKQRNTAKRNSIPRSSSSNQSATMTVQPPPILNINQSLTAQQQSDLSFLQTQKFEKDFIQTTKELFARYPNAKISISVTVSQIQNCTSQQPTVVQTQSTRQIEIDRVMFEKICTFQQIQPLNHSKVQPQTPIRTTSISNNNNSSYHSVSSSSPSSSSSSSSSSAYDTGLLQSEPPQLPKQEDLNEAIKRAAAEHLIKRQSNQSDLSSPIYRAYVPNGSNGSNVSQLKQQLNNQIKSSFHAGSEAVKNELERALENRLRKQQQQEQSQMSQNNTTAEEQQNEVNKRNVPRDPPPPLPHVDTDAKSTVIFSQPPPPPPPPMTALFPHILSNNSCTSFPPPPSPLALRRLSTTIDVNPNIKSPISPGPPPPPPPLPTSFSSITHVNVVNTQTATSSASTNLNVKSIINNYQQTTQQLLDPRTSSDFSELIAKKAAEKRAKFQESKPLISNAVTFQPDGSKVFVTNNKNIDNSITNINKFQPPQPLANNHTNTSNSNFKKTTTSLVSTIEKNVNISNGHAQASSSSLSFSSSSTHSSSSPSMSSTFSEKDEGFSSNKSEMNSNRNESFINTASKLLERVKQQHNISFEETSPKITTSTSTLPEQIKQNSIIAQSQQNQSVVTNIKC